MGSSWTDYFTITIVELLKSNINNSCMSINGLLKIDYFRDWNLIFQIFWLILHKNCERQLIETTSFGQLVLFKVKSGSLPSFCQFTLQGTRNEEDRSHQRTSTARGLNLTRNEDDRIATRWTIGSDGCKESGCWNAPSGQLRSVGVKEMLLSRSEWPLHQGGTRRKFPSTSMPDRQLWSFEQQRKPTTFKKKEIISGSLLLNSLHQLIQIFKIWSNGYK